MFDGKLPRARRSFMKIHCQPIAVENIILNEIHFDVFSDANDILQRAIKAAGGAGRIGALKTPMMWMEKGTYYGQGEGMPYIAQYAAKWPDWYRQEIEGKFVITVNGDKAWVSSGACPSIVNNSSARLRM